MALQAPWSVKGVDVKAREAAKLMARRAGLTLGEWLNRSILEESSRPEPAAGPPRAANTQAELQAVETLGREVIALAQALDRRLRAAEGQIRTLAETDARSAETIEDLAQRLREGEARLASWINTARSAGAGRPLQPTPFDALAADAGLPDGPPAQDLFDAPAPMTDRADQARPATGLSASLDDDDADFIPIPSRAPPTTGAARRRAAADRRVAVIVASAACCLALAGAGVWLLRDRPVATAPQTPAQPAPAAARVDPAVTRLEGLAAAGDAAAMHELGLAYFNGDGAPKDLTQAVRWFRAAAEKGLAPAQHNLAMMYAAGSGAPRDPVEACAWFSVAATAGDAEAGKALRAIWKELTPEQRQAANARVATLRGALRI